MSIKKLVTLSLFVCFSMALYAFESVLPPLLVVPGAKLGLSNIVTLVAIVILGTKEALTLLFIRIVLVGLLFGQIVSLSFSLAGGILSFIVMALLLKWFSNECMYLVGIFGAVFHNLGQILVAFLITKSTVVFYYFPFMFLLAIPTGLLTGFSAYFSVKLIKKAKII